MTTVKPQHYLVRSVLVADEFVSVLGLEDDDIKDRI